MTTEFYFNTHIRLFRRCYMMSLAFTATATSKPVARHFRISLRFSIIVSIFVRMDYCTLYLCTSILDTLLILIRSGKKELNVSYTTTNTYTIYTDIQIFDR